LVDLIAVLALVALVGALLVGGGDLLRAATRSDAEETALTAIARARHEAVLGGRIVELRQDAKERRLDWGTGQLPWGGADDVRLLPPAMASAVIVGGRLQEAPLARVRFYPDGTCDPFRLEIARAGETTRRVVAIDPWTAVPLAKVGEDRR
jgi:Tfp pilus assembly protein FimT